MPIERPDRFDQRDLFIDVRLEALIDGEPIDFTGRRYFSIGFFREGIGFGITDVKIEVNTSLQPIIEITFMDLYGNTMFGGQYNEKNVDYSSFFRWPPPKFLFTFKGYLGRPVTWMLNLKQYDINFISKTGHYELKATFVPNQWGFFADIPFLYLLAAKRLRMNKGKSQDEAMTIFDLIKIGKQVEIKTEETTKKFDVILKKIGSMQSDMVGALTNSKLVSFGEIIIGQVGGQTIQGFKEIEIGNIMDGQIDPVDVDRLQIAANATGTSFGVKSLEDIALFSDRNLMNQFLLSKVKIDRRNGQYYYYSLERFKALPNNVREAEKSRVVNELQNNIVNINEEIQASVYDSTKTELSQTTIGEVFRQIAKDTAYIMGRILEAGFRGNSNDNKNTNGFTDRYDRRNLQQSDSRPSIIGQYYPLTEENGSEVPAMNGFGITDPGCEMDFVNEFISAVIEGIAKDLMADEQLSGAISDDKLTARISNIEALSKNPYRANYESITENIIARSGILAFMVRSNDCNLPGDYGNGTIVYDGEIYYGKSPLPTDQDGDVENIVAAAREDAKNITDTMLGGIPSENILQLRSFVDFFDKLLTPNGEDFLNSEGKNAEFLEDKLTDDVTIPLDVSILDYKVIMKLPNGSKAEDFNTQEKINQAIANKTLDPNDCRTVRSVFAEVIQGPSQIKNFINIDYLSSRMLVNNGLIYAFPHNADDEYFFVAYEGADARARKEALNAKTDYEYQNENAETFLGNPNNIKDNPRPTGLVEISRYYDDKSENALLRVKKFNEAVTSGLVLDYRKLRLNGFDFNNHQAIGSALGDDILFPNNGSNITQTQLPPSMDSLLWKKQVVPETDNIPQKEMRFNISASENLLYEVAYHKDEDDDIPVTRLVFGPFLKGTKSKNQRVFLKTICSEIKKKIDDLAIQQQETISRVLGKADEQKKIIYKQFHSLFHQWNTIAYKDNVSSEGTINGSSLPENGIGIANDLEDLYGGGKGTQEDRHKDLNSIDIKEVQNLPDPTFVYDYPLQRIREMNGPSLSTIDVRNSIINLDPLFKPDANTTVLNMLYNLCNKNNFLFIPIPGYAGYLNVKDVYKPYVGQAETRIRNFFHVLFMLTPESRSMISNKTNTGALTMHDSDLQRNIKGDAISVQFGATDNNIVKNVSVSTRDNKVTAESIINLQRLTDKEDHNKTVTTDCSMLNVMAGRSYVSRVDTLGNAQIYPMQFYFLEKMPLFDGLYQIMKVEHSITPNNMNTTFEGIRMRFNSEYMSIPPITLDGMQRLLEERPRNTQDTDNVVANADGIPFDPSKQAGEGELSDGQNVEGVRANGTENSQQVILLPYIKQAQQSSRLTNMGDAGPIVDNIGPDGRIADKGGIIQCMNHFIEDILEPFAKYFKERDPDLFKKWHITSAARKYKAGGKTTSQHLRGQAVDSSIVFSNQAEGLMNNHKLFNYIMDFYAANPSLEYGQILLETKSTAGRPQIWIHWSYRRIGENYKQRLRFVNDAKLIGARMNTERGGPQVNKIASLEEARMKNLLG